MSKYTITYACGHTEEKQIYGKESERAGKAEWMGRGLCPACRAKAARESGITDGSDKQVAWAKDIRDAMASEVKTTKALASDAFREPIVAWIDSHHDASWYIDNQCRTDIQTILAAIPQDTLLAIAKEAQQ